MCGIAGFLAAPGRSAAMLADDRITAMRDALAHRGPDDAGLWIDHEAGIALAHRRLAIVDLSAAGHQPMASACGRYRIVYNGEIYNHAELRAALPPQAWQGHSDTETLLALIARDGLAATLPRLVGMFAFALWDREAGTLTLARDRLGEKPLYWARLGDAGWAFGSELRALRAHPAFDARLDRQAVARLMRQGCIPAPQTVWAGVHKLEPGCTLVLKAGAEPRHGRYWSLPEVAARGLAQPLALSDEDAADALQAGLERSLRGQMLADVPLGAFLSGGVDSSAVVALMARLAPQRVRTFCIGFADGTSEAEHARAVARHLGTDHTEFTVTAADALALVPTLPQRYDEPFADSSQIPTLLVCRMARQQVTVALSGDAGDELFGGYNRYLIADRLMRRLQRLPLGLRRRAAGLILAVAPDRWDSLLALPQRLRPAARRHADVGAKLHKLARDVLPARDAQALYRALSTQWPAELPLVLGTEAGEPAAAAAPAGLWDDPVAGMSLADQAGYLPDDILVKVDRAAMAHSLETRAPFLDHRLVEWSWRLPRHQKLRDGQGKWLLRQVLYRHVPKALIERPKQGFAVPLAAWLRGPLRGWAEDLLDPALLARQGVLAAAPVRQAWAEHLSGRHDRAHALWNVLMFQAWWQDQAR